jgi:hypothetical protein
MRWKDWRRTCRGVDKSAEMPKIHTIRTPARRNPGGFLQSRPMNVRSYISLAAMAPLFIAAALGLLGVADVASWHLWSFWALACVVIWFPQSKNPCP